MIYKVRYTPLAAKDLEGVWEDVREASGETDTADSYISGMIRKIADKKTFPESGIPLYYRGLFTGYYSVNYKAYKAFYRIRDGYIEVARVMMAKRDFMTILFGEDEEA